MQVNGLDGKKYRWNPIPDPLDDRPCSSYHLACRELLSQMFPSDPKCEEVHLPGASSALYCDFYLPVRKLMIEVDGKQHFEANGFFGGNDGKGGKLAFIRGQKRDREKERWAELNGFTLVRLAYNNQKEWQSIIKKALEG